jgi:hypothetical protein
MAKRHQSWAEVILSNARIELPQLGPPIEWKTIGFRRMRNWAHLEVLAKPVYGVKSGSYAREFGLKVELVSPVPGCI